MMKLYCSNISPFARKVMILARLKGIEMEEIPVSADGKRGYTQGANPLGKIPALIRGDGLPMLMDSQLISEYVDSLSDPLLPASGEARWTQLRLQALGDGLADAAYQYRYETVRPEALHWDAIIARQDYAMRSALQALEDHADILGDPWTYGNISVVCGLGYLGYRGPHIDWRHDAPKLAKWHEAFEKEAVWQETHGYNAN